MYGNNMKKFIFTLIISVMFGLTSCITPISATAQEISYYDDYVYLGVTYPVLYINSIPHYFYGERWIVVPNTHYHYIRHYRRPLHFRGTPPQNWRPVHRYENRRVIINNGHTGYRPQVRPSQRPNIGQPNRGNSQRQFHQGGSTLPRGGRR